MEQEKQECDVSTYVSPVLKRRSSLFAKRLSSGNYKQAEAIQDAENDGLPKENGCAEDEITLEEYVAKLGKERKDWKAVKQDRKKRMKASEKALAHGSLVIKWEESQDFLTDEDKHFIAQLPDCTATLQKLEEAEKNIALYEQYKTMLAQTAMYLVDRLDGKPVVGGISDIAVEKISE